MRSRPPASAFKPFVYLAALEGGLAPGSLIDAGPVDIDVPGALGPYRPRNHDGRAYAKVSLADGLVHSINTAAVHLLHGRAGFDRLFSVLARLGIETSGLERQWGLALGHSSIPLIEMSAAYGVFANGGFGVRPHAFVALTNESGTTVWARAERPPKRVFGARAIADLNEMLVEAVRIGTGRRAAHDLSAAVKIAGKTGTGDGFVDAWFVGYTPELVIGVWVGNDRPVSMPGVYGGTAPARVFNAILRDLARHTTLLVTADPP